MVETEAGIAIDEPVKTEQAACCVADDYIAKVIPANAYTAAFFCSEDIMVAPKMGAAAIDLNAMLCNRFAVCIV